MIMYIQQFLLLLIFTASISGQMLDVKPAVNRLYVREGSSEELTCSAGPGKNVVWVKPDQSDANETSKPDGTVTIKINNFNVTKHSGNYTCLINKPTKNQFTILAIGVTEKTSEPKYEFPEQLGALACKLTFNPSNEVKEVSNPEWYKNEKKISSLADYKTHYEVSKTTGNLTIIDATRKDAGEYKAEFNITSAKDDSINTYTCNVVVLADPYVREFDKSKNLIQKEDLELRCEVYGYPKSEVTWYKDGGRLNGSNIKMQPLNGHKNGLLTIKEVDFSDAGVYNCTAYSSFLKSSDSKVIVVRVKDKLAALWPFLGIVAEVLVLCLIIFIYEKRRNKQAQQAENDAQEIDQTEKKGNVRNRRNQK